MKYENLYISLMILVAMICLSPFAIADENSDGIVVWNLEAQAGVSKQEANSLLGIITKEVGRNSGLKVISEADIQTMLKGEQTRQKCDTEDTACLAEIGNALGVPEAISGDLAHFGNTWILNIRRINIITAEVLARVSRRITGSLENVVTILPGAVSEMFGEDKAKRAENAIIVWQLKPQQGVKGREVHSLSGIVSAEVEQQSNRQVYSEMGLRAILKGEETRQKCGINDTSCLAQVGNAAGVPEAISGEVSHIGSTWILSLRLMNTKKAEVTGRASRRVGGSIENLIKIIPSAVAEILGLEAPKEGVTLNNPLNGLLTIVTEPTGAELFIGDEKAGTSPHTVELWPGEYEIEAKLKGYRTKLEDVEVIKGESTNLTIALIPEKGILKITTKPEKATIFVDGKKLGNAPQKVKFDPGKYKIAVMLDGYAKQEKSVRIKAGKSKKIDFDLKKIESRLLIVNSEPSGAKLFLSDKNMGKTPVRKKLLPGTYNLKLQHEGYVALERSIKVSERKNTSLMLKLTADYPMNPYKKWGYISFFTGVGLMAFGGISTWQAADAADSVSESGDWSSEDSNKMWSGLSATGYALGGAMMITGVVLWVLSPGDEAYWTQARAGLSPTASGDGLAVNVSGSW